MTVAVQTIYNTYTANGTTTVFPYTFKTSAAEDLKISIDGVVQTSGFSASNIGVDGGGDITFAVAPTNGQVILIELFPIAKRTTNYIDFGDWDPAVVNLDFDRLWLAIQKISNDILRSLKLPVDTGADQVITDSAALRALKVLGFDASGNLIMYDYPATLEANALAAEQGALTAEAAAQAAQAAAATSESNAAASETAAAGSAAAAATSETNAAASASAAAASAADAAASAGIPQNSQSANYTAVLSDANKHLFHPAADNNPRTFTIPANASVAYPIGTSITFVNEVNTLTIAINTDTLQYAGGTSTGSRTLAANGIATALKVTATKWYINGSGLS